MWKRLTGQSYIVYKRVHVDALSTVPRSIVQDDELFWPFRNVEVIIY